MTSSTRPKRQMMLILFSQSILTKKKVLGVFQGRSSRSVCQRNAQLESVPALLRWLFPWRWNYELQTFLQHSWILRRLSTRRRNDSAVTFDAAQLFGKARKVGRWNKENFGQTKSWLRTQPYWRFRQQTHLAPEQVDCDRLENALRFVAGDDLRKVALPHRTKGP